MAIGFIERYVAVDINGANALPQHVVEGIAFVGKNGVVEDGALLKYKLTNMAANAVNKTSNAVTIRTPFENPMYVENALYSDVPFEQFGNVDEWHVAEGYTFTSADGFKATGKIPVYDYTSIEAEYQEETDEGFIFMGSVGSGVLVEDEINLAVKKEKFGDADPRAVRAGFRFTSAFGVDEEGTMPTVEAATPYLSAFATDDVEECEIHVRATTEQQEGYVTENLKYSETFVKMEIDGNKVTMYCGDVSVKKKVADVYGNADADKNIILDGELPNGFYTVFRQTPDGLLRIGNFTAGMLYTNLVPLSTMEDDKTIYNGGLGYKNGYRIRSGGAEAVQSDATCIGFIPVNPGDVIGIGGAIFGGASGANSINVYDASHTNLGQVVENSPTAGYGIFAGGTLSNWNKGTLKNDCFYWTVPSGADIAYVRVTARMNGKGVDMIVTRNEEIV